MLILFHGGRRIKSHFVVPCKMFGALLHGNVVATGIHKHLSVNVSVGTQLLGTPHPLEQAFLKLDIKGTLIRCVTWQERAK